GANLQAAMAQQVFSETRQETSQPIQQCPLYRPDRQNGLWIPVTQQAFDRPTKFPFIVVLHRLGSQAKRDLVVVNSDERWIPILVISVLREEVNQRKVSVDGCGNSGAGGSEINAESHCRTSHRLCGGTRKRPAENQRRGQVSRRLNSTRDR